MSGRVVHLILIVSADPGLRQARRQALRRAGYHVLPAAGLRHALMLVGKVRPSVVLADADVGDGRAIALLQALRAVEALRGVHVIVLGSVPRAEQAQLADDPRAQAHGGDDTALLSLLHDLLAA